MTSAIESKKKSRNKKLPTRKDVSQERDEMASLKDQILALESEIKNLRTENSALKRQSASPVKSYEQSLREQRHNFFKYSNARKYY